MPQTKSQKEKSKSPMCFIKPIPGKRILTVDINKEDIEGTSNQYLNAPVSGWTSPSKLVNSIEIDNILKAGPRQALSYIRESWDKIKKSDQTTGQLSRFASSCHNYSFKPKFSEEFIKLYAAKRGRVQDSSLKENSSILSSKAIDSASNITDKALNVIKESTLRQMDDDYPEVVGNDDQDEWSEKENTTIEGKDFLGPAREINYSPNQPKLSTVHIESVRTKCLIAISSMSLLLVPSVLREELNNNHANQKALKSLGDFPHVLEIVKQIMDDDIDYCTFPMKLWNYQTQALTWDPMENAFFSMISIIMTDFWGLFMRVSFNAEHERTFWVEYVVPLFKHFSNMNKGVIFSWCESMVSSHNKSQIIPGVWNNTIEKLFADGIARKDDFEVIVMESSGPFSVELVNHSVDDTWKLITMSTNSLRNEILKYQDAALETAKGLAVFGIQCICDKITLLKTSLHNPNKWQTIELRSAVIPVSWDTRTSMIPVFELLATLQLEYDLQKDVLKKLRRENNFLDSVEEKETIRFQFENSTLLQ